MSFVIAAFIGYLFGSIPFGLIFTACAGLGDIRKVGSGNIGATNVLRTGRKDLAFLTTLCDIGKAVMAVILVKYIFNNPVELPLTAGFFSVVGHNFPVWLGFKGGKGVASTLGMMMATSFSVGALTAVTWLGVALISKYSSLSAIIALSSAPVFALCMLDEPQPYIICYAALAVLSIIRHKANIRRLWLKQESKVSFTK
ncbi:MAG: glycerol-3-phosphate 1-O-acyltransferase PlsY [Alphaproteobacteria bacterium]|nr:glycerol-3-phosphate 1-O-acyltransferase PlsY [Alphaproteobacteria bacterium]